eukprot:887757-Rhodomonas_salina.1
MNSTTFSMQHADASMNGGAEQTCWLPLLGRSFNVRSNSSSSCRFVTLCGVCQPKPEGVFLCRKFCGVISGVYPATSRSMFEMLERFEDDCCGSCSGSTDTGADCDGSATSSSRLREAPQPMLPPQ